MILTERESQTIQDLQTQEECCLKKYEAYEKKAHDGELKSLFSTLKEDEKRHYDSLSQVLMGSVPACDCNDSKGKDYAPTATYNSLSSTKDKEEDNFLVTDCIGTEKLVSGEYNSNVFNCSDPDLRKLLADIQIEEQNHAMMLYKYKEVNAMC